MRTDRYELPFPDERAAEKLLDSIRFDDDGKRVSWWKRAHSQKQSYRPWREAYLKLIAKVEKSDPSFQTLVGNGLRDSPKTRLGDMKLHVADFNREYYAKEWKQVVKSMK